GGKRYEVSPAALLLSEENYYLVAYDREAGLNKHFRLDKMTEIELLSEKRDREVTDVRFNPAEYSKRSFAMYGGREELVTLECRERLAGVIIDRFGQEQSFFPTEFGFRVSVRVIVSPTFFAWVLGFGTDMRILAPLAVKEELLSRLSDIRECYLEGER
ncbi:MAG: WYL domain-containing protein, partial [Clostridia bacterium]|nr:WYL domain-containing protein [Clostridia bacterium]